MAKFHLKMLGPEKTVFEGTVESVFVQGDSTEFELLSCHYPVMCTLDNGKIVLDKKKHIHIKSGIIKFSENECIILTD